jgi:hypothetical protein
MTSPSQVLFLQRKAEPEDRIIRSPLDDDATPSRDFLRAVISKPTADSLILLMSADDDFLTPKLRFGKKTHPFPRAQDPVPTMIVEVSRLTRRFVPMELSWSLDLSGQLLGVGLHPVTKTVGFQGFRNFIPKHAFTRYCF